MKEQSTSIIKDLQDSNNELKNLKEAYKRISENQEVQGDAAKNMKEHMLNYLNFIDAMISANDIDIEDHNTLCSLLGDKYYDGALIKEQEDLWLSEKARDEKERDDSYNKWMNSDNTPLGIAMFYYHYFRYCMFDLQVKNDEKEYQRWYADELAFDEISENTSELFTRSPEIRKIARDNINNMLLSLESGNYKSDVIDLNWKDKYMDQLQAKWYKYDEEGNKIIDSEKIKSDLDRADELSEGEFEALLLLCKDNDIQLGENVTRENIKECVFEALEIMMFANLDDKNNRSTPYESLSLEERKLYVMLYEDKNESDALAMDGFLDDMPTGEGLDINGNAHSYDEDNWNIRFMVYASPETERKIFLQYCSRVVVDWDYNRNPCWDGFTLHIDLDGYDDPIYGRQSPLNLYPRGAYVALFHEFGHYLDDILGNGITGGFGYKTGKEKLTNTLLEEVKKGIFIDLTTYCNDSSVNISLTEDEKNQIVNGMCCRDNGQDITEGWTEDMVSAYNGLVEAYNNDSNLIENRPWDNSESCYKYEAVTDIYSGATDNRVDWGIGHDSKTYWYSVFNNPKGSFGKEFFAEMFSFEMTYSPLNQYDITSSVLGESTKKYDEIINSIEVK